MFHRRSGRDPAIEAGPDEENDDRDREGEETRRLDRGRYIVLAMEGSGESNCRPRSSPRPFFVPNES
jgi:hypothetical protein